MVRFIHGAHTGAPLQWASWGNNEMADTQVRPLQWISGGIMADTQVGHYWFIIASGLWVNVIFG